MQAVRVIDEGIHDWGPEENWQESVVLVWRDAESGLGGNHRVSVQPNRNVSNLWCGVYHNRDKAYRLNLENQPFEPLDSSIHGLSCGPQKMFHDGTNLRLKLDSPECSVDLIVVDFDSSIERVDADHDGKMSAEIYRNHYNLHCHVYGTVVLNGVKHEVKDALGWRDHSWGPRDWTQVLCHRSFHGSFGEDLNFHLLTVLTRDGKLDRRGHLVRNGLAINVDTFTIRTEMLEDGISPVQTHCHIYLPDGEELYFTCLVQKGVIARVETKQAFYGMGECRHEGRKDGFSNCEITNNPRAGVGDITTVIGNTLTNGYHEISDEPWKFEPLPRLIL